MRHAGRHVPWPADGFVHAHLHDQFLRVARDQRRGRRRHDLRQQPPSARPPAGPAGLGAHIVPVRRLGGRRQALPADKLDGIPYDGKFLFTEQGYNFLPLEISAAFGLVQLRKLRGFTSTRRKNFARLQRTFARHDAFFSAPRQLSEVKTNWLAFPLTIREDAKFSRLELVRFLERRNIQTRPVFTGNVLRQPAYRAMQNGQLFPAADRIMRDAFLIGCHQGLSSTQLDHLEATFEEFLRRRGSRRAS